MSDYTADIKGLGGSKNGRARRNAIRRDLYNRFELVGNGKDGTTICGELYIPKSQTALAENDTITLTVVAN